MAEGIEALTLNENEIPILPRHAVDLHRGIGRGHRRLRGGAG
jgi:hypothetical protein